MVKQQSGSGNIAAASAATNDNAAAYRERDRIPARSADVMPGDPSMNASRVAIILEFVQFSREVRSVSKRRL